VRNIEKTTDTDLVIKGFLNNLLNPKALLFFSLFLPQFTTQTTALSGQILILGLLLSGFALLTNLVFALSFSQFAKLLGNKSNLTKHVDALLGVVFLGLATRLAISK
jgi:threonine/homoserine/homoserine lactone efflux protein